MQEEDHKNGGDVALFGTQRTGKFQDPKFEQNILLVREPDEAFDMAGENLLRTTLKRTHKERFFK